MRKRIFDKLNRTLLLYEIRKIKVADLLHIPIQTI